MRYTHKIDFQSHYLPPAYLDFLRRHHPGDPDGYPTPDYWNMDWQRDKMGLLGVSYAHLMLSSPNIWMPDASECLGLARLINDQGAAMAASDPSRFGLIATLPLPYERESVAETKRVMDELHADGVGLTTNHHGCYLGDPRLDSLMRELDARGALVIIHPTAPAVHVPGVCEGLSLPAFEYFVETTRAFTNMVMNDTFVRFPDIKWVLPHAGAFTSILSDRFESFALILRMNDPDRRADFKEAMAHVYFDVAGFSEPKQLADLLLDVPESHLLYGSDTPYTPIEACLGQTCALEETDKLTDMQKRALFTGNALAVNPRLASIPALAAAAREPSPAARDKIRVRSVAAARDVPRPGRRHWMERLRRRLFAERHVALPVPVPPKAAQMAVRHTVAEERALRFGLESSDDPKLADRYVVHLASPVGEIVIPVIVVFDDADRTTFHGKAKVMGLVTAYRDGRRVARDTEAGCAECAEYAFDIRVRLPFGPLDVHLDVTMDEGSGEVRGVATAPYRRPMRLTGSRAEAAPPVP